MLQQKQYQFTLFLFVGRYLFTIKIMWPKMIFENDMDDSSDNIGNCQYARELWYEL